MKLGRLLFRIFFWLVITSPVTSYLAWVFTPKKPFKILIIDKTVLTKEGREHMSLNWLLKYKKYVKEDGSFYITDTDYKGFFPLENDSFEIHDLKKFSERQIDSLADYYDMVYYADLYGMYYNEWYRDTMETERSEKVYGGMDANDLLLLKKMKERNKLVYSEFNMFAHPTAYGIRTETEKTLGIKWTGWTGRYFDLLDTIKNPELPRWLIRLYKEQHNYQWPFKGPGIAFVHEDERVEILDKDSDLRVEVPMIYSTAYTMEKFNVEDGLNYPYWFDIIENKDSANKTLSWYHVDANARGMKLLRKHGIPNVFPAGFEHPGPQPHFYFCGDFTDYPANFKLIQFKGIYYVHRLRIGNKQQPSSNDQFHYKYYLPLTHRVLKEYYERIKK